MYVWDVLQPDSRLFEAVLNEPNQQWNIAVLVVKEHSGHYGHRYLKSYRPRSKPVILIIQHDMEQAEAKRCHQSLSHHPIGLDSLEDLDIGCVQMVTAMIDFFIIPDTERSIKWVLNLRVFGMQIQYYNTSMAISNGTTIKLRIRTFSSPGRNFRT